MSKRPSALELEILSDSELMDKIAEAFQAIKNSDTTFGDNSPEQKLYRSLEIERTRRKVAAKAAPTDEDLPAETR
ncbi:MAG: hypothetical protein ABI970_26230 [Chloroflexota bacterium]